jgi:hypothetical protein
MLRLVQGICLLERNDEAERGNAASGQGQLVLRSAAQIRRMDAICSRAPKKAAGRQKNAPKELSLFGASSSGRKLSR